MSCLSCDFIMPHGLRLFGVSCDVSVPLDCRLILAVVRSKFHSGSDVGLVGCFQFTFGRDGAELMRWPSLVH